MIEGRTGPWETVIGLEVHAQIVSKAKLFSGAATAFGAEPNTQVSPVDAAFPGMLPVINRHCVEQAVRTGLGLDAEINLTSVFDRKNYFYPDLPAGYQISQYLQPVVGHGRVVLDMPDGSTRAIGITRLHLEQDAGKSLHDQHPSLTYVDLNRAGIGLMEIVSEPDLRSAEEAGIYLRKLRSILRYLGTCDGNMDEGSMRCDANVSVRRPGRALRHPLRDQKRQLGALCDAGDRIRGAPPGRIDRGRRPGGAADPPLRCGARHDPADALQGGGARLPLFPRPGPPAIGARPGLGRRAARRIARIAGCEKGAVRLGARAFARGGRGAGGRAGQCLVLRARCRGPRPKGCGQLGHRRSVRGAAPAGDRHRAIAGLARAAGPADRFDRGRHDFRAPGQGCVRRDGRERRRSGRNRRTEGAAPGDRHRRHRRRDRRGARRPARQARRIPRRPRQALWLFRRPGDARDRGQGQPRAGQRAIAAEAAG